MLKDMDNSSNLDSIPNFSAPHTYTRVVEFSSDKDRYVWEKSYSFKCVSYVFFIRFGFFAAAESLTAVVLAIAIGVWWSLWLIR